MVHLGVVTALTALCLWVMIRRCVIGDHRDKEVTAALVALTVALLFSLPATNNAADHVVGGVSAVNAISHCLMGTCGWFMGRGFFAAPGAKRAEWPSRWIILAVSIGGILACWLTSATLLGRSRVVHDSPLSGPYWTFTLVPYVVLLLPALRAPQRVIRWLSGRGIRRGPRWGLVTSYILVALAYLDISAGLLVLWLTEIVPEPHLVMVREAMVYLGPLLLLLALLLCPVSARFTQRARPAR